MSTTAEGTEVRVTLTDEERMTYAVGTDVTGEEEMLRQIPEEQIEAFCKYKLTPYKTNLDFAYAEQATFRTDVALMLRTAQVCVVRSKARPPQPSAIL